jgi:hypothetical protein
VLVTVIVVHVCSPYPAAALKKTSGIVWLSAIPRVGAAVGADEVEAVVAVVVVPPVTEKLTLKLREVMFAPPETVTAPL